jgi:uncharacterized C2H2 Zn-finger protein
MDEFVRDVKKVYHWLMKQGKQMKRRKKKKGTSIISWFSRELNR